MRSGGQARVRLGVLVLVILALLALRLVAQRWAFHAGEPASDGIRAFCQRVVDGDTIVLAGGERLRYIGIDTPETVDPRRPVEAFGHEAARYNLQLVEGREVRIELDVQERDRYGRLLGYVYVTGDDGREVFVNAELVRQGYARVSTWPPNVRYAEYFHQLEREARQAGRGLWSEAASGP